MKTRNLYIWAVIFGLLIIIFIINSLNLSFRINQQARVDQPVINPVSKPVVLDIRQNKPVLKSDSARFSKRVFLDNPAITIEYVPEKKEKQSLAAVDNSQEHKFNMQSYFSLPKEDSMEAEQKASFSQDENDSSSLNQKKSNNNATVSDSQVINQKGIIIY